jgi:hypothetical protein
MPFLRRQAGGIYAITESAGDDRAFLETMGTLDCGLSVFT